MGRPKQFDPEVALERAMEVFWRQGYEATTIQDLVEVTGVNRASMYSTFGDKHQLFVAALDHYAQSAGRELITLLEREGPAREVLEQAFAQIVEWQAGEAPNPGCFVTNSAVELCERCPETATKVNASFQRLRDAFARLVARGQEEGQLSREHEPEAVGDYLASLVQGLVVLGKAKCGREVLERAARVGLSGLTL